MRACILLALLAAWPIYAQEDQDDSNWGIKPNTDWEVTPDTSWEVQPGTNWGINPSPNEGSTAVEPPVLPQEPDTVHRVDDARSAGFEIEDTPKEKRKPAPKEQQKAERDTVPKGRHAESERVTNPSKSESPIWKAAQPYKNGLRKSGDEVWDWDATHNDIEVYDRHGRHRGSRNPTTGEMYKPAIPGRKLKKI
jgi:hypothetical protein